MSNHIVNLATEIVPPAIESKKNDWVEWGADNNYFAYLRNRYVYSATNNTVINNFVKLFQGNGLTSPEKAIKPSEWAKVISIFKDEELEKIGFDFKTYGQEAMQIIRTKGKLSAIKHISVEKLRLGKKDKDGIIQNVWYCEDWTQTKKFKPESYSIWNKDNKDEISIVWTALYTLGEDYYSLPDWFGAMPYTILEEEIADYLINDVRNGFSGTSVINFNTGIIPNEEIQSKIANDTVKNVTGSKGKKCIVSFVPSVDAKTTIDSIPLNNAPEHYKYLSEECVTQILKGHNVTSGLLFGISSSTGFSSNADELKNAFNLYQIEVLTNYHNKFLNSLMNVFANDGTIIKLAIDVINPFGQVEQFNGAQIQNAVDIVSKVSEGIIKSEQAKILLTQLLGFPKNITESLFPKEVTTLSKQKDFEVFEELEKMADNDMQGWVLYDSHPVIDSDVDLDIELEKANTTLLQKVVNLASTGTARGNARSSQDGKDYKIRYRYTGSVNDESRTFCKLMVNANKVYRKEDIIAMSDKAVNEGFGVDGADTYDIWKYKGGARCKHVWFREIYLIEGANVDVNSPNAQKIKVWEAQKKGLNIGSVGQESVRPNDMPYNGYTESYYNKTFKK